MATAATSRPSGPVLSQPNYRYASLARVKLAAASGARSPGKSVCVSSPSASSAAAKSRRSCMCSPTNHPDSFRCSLHKARKLAAPGSKPAWPPSPPPPAAVSRATCRLDSKRMGGALVRLGGAVVSGTWARRALAPCPQSQHRRCAAGGFRPRPSRLSAVSFAASSRPLASAASHGVDAQPEGGRAARAAPQPPTAASDEPPRRGGAQSMQPENSGRLLLKKKHHEKAPPKHHGHGHHAHPADISPPPAAPAPAWPFPEPQPRPDDQPPPIPEWPRPGNHWLPLPPLPAWPRPEPGNPWPKLPPFPAWPQPGPGKQWPPFPAWPQPEPGNNQWPPLPPLPDLFPAPATSYAKKKKERPPFASRPRRAARGWTDQCPPQSMRISVTACVILD